MLKIFHLTREQKMHYTLRIAVAMCFIGHGAFGIITKPVWCNYFAVFGISHDLSYRLMPLVGSMDVLMGMIVLIYPIRVLPAWLVGWGIVTASLRPLSGEPFGELIERAGNFGAPLALLILSGWNWKNIKDIFRPIDPDRKADQKTMNRVILCLKIVVFLLLTGHGWLNIIEKKGLLDQYASLGFPNPARTALSLGIFEIIAAASILIRPFRTLILILFIWKMCSEFFYPHYELFEWVERGGSYGSLLALWFALGPSTLPSFGKKFFSKQTVSSQSSL
jgi:hypothetical protein